MPQRSYPHELPLNIPSFYVRVLEGKIVDAGLWSELPIPLLNRLEAARINGTGEGITQADLDSIDDKTWAKVAKLLNL